MPMTLKTKNIKFVIPILMMDMALLLTMPSSYTIISLPMLEARPLTPIESGTIISMASITWLLISQLIPPNLKATIVFWRLCHALPGCRAFSKHAHQDSRIDITILQKKLGPFPTTAKEQNVLWYKLFKHYESNTAVQEAHQRFLFFRDITAMTVLVLACFLVLACLDPLNIKDYKYAFELIMVQYFLFMVAARNTANRLIQDVLALESVSLKLTQRPKK